MNKKAFLINIGRGNTLNESDLLVHLNKNKDFFASLDVFKNEPLPKKVNFGHIKMSLLPHMLQH